MPPQRLTPPEYRLRQYVDRGLTQRQMIDEWEKESGFRPERRALSVAIYRAGLSKPRVRHNRAVPWKLDMKDQRNTHIQMLRALSAREQGYPLAKHTLDHLEQWQRRIKGQRIMYVAGDGVHAVWEESVPPELLDDRFPIVLKDERGDTISQEQLKEYEALDQESARARLSPEE